MVKYLLDIWIQRYEEFFKAILYVVELHNVGVSSHG